MILDFECDLRWRDLHGTSNVRRHCERCDHAVYNLSGMTDAQAKQVIEEHEGKKLCVRIVTREGRIVHARNAEQQLRVQRRGSRKLVAAALLVQSAFVAFADEPAESWYDPFRAIAEILTPEPVEDKFTMGNYAVTSDVVF